MKLSQHILGLIAGSFLFAVQGHAGTFLFEIKNVPVATQSCTQIAQGVADRLVAVGNVKVNRSYCMAVNSRFNTVHVVYEAPQELVAIDTLNHNSIDVGIDQGTHKTIADCQKDLPGQQTEFATMTGASVVAAFCSQQSTYGSHPVSQTIVGVVTAADTKKRVIYKTLGILGNASGDAEAVAKTFADKLRAQGVNVRKVVFADDPAFSRLQVSYYGTEPLKIDLKQKIGFESPTVCQARSAAVLAAMAQIGTQLYVSFCSPDEYSHKTKFFTVGYVASKETVWTEVPGFYSDRKSCEDDQKHMEEVYRGQGLAVAGSICSFDSKNYQVVILSGAAAEPAE